MRRFYQEPGGRIEGPLVEIVVGVGKRHVAFGIIKFAVGIEPLVSAAE